MCYPWKKSLLTYRSITPKPCMRYASRPIFSSRNWERMSLSMVITSLLIRLWLTGNSSKNWLFTKPYVTSYLMMNSMLIPWPFPIGLIPVILIIYIGPVKLLPLQMLLPHIANNWLPSSRNRQKKTNLNSSRCSRSSFWFSKIPKKILNNSPKMPKKLILIRKKSIS